MKKERLFSLDFIRAISVILIVTFHFGTTLIGYNVNSLFSKHWSFSNGDIGSLGISLFFIISGAALMVSYNKDFSLMTYLYKRFRSIFPMFWIAYVIAFLYLFYYYKAIQHLPNINFLLTVVGMDGYMYYKVPTYYILGEWFLGCIILLYLCFPILRLIVIKYPKTLLIMTIVLYVVFVEMYRYEMDITRNFILRIPELLIGMYFGHYFRMVKWYYFLVALSLTILMLLIRLDINHMYNAAITGLAVFAVLVFVGQQIHSKAVKSVFEVISKYSFAIFLTHHVIMTQFLLRFKQLNLTVVESMSLYIITCTIIGIASVYLYKLENKVVSYLEMKQYVFSRQGLSKVPSVLAEYNKENVT